MLRGSLTLQDVFRIRKETVKQATNCFHSSSVQLSGRVADCGLWEKLLHASDFPAEMHCNRSGKTHRKTDTLYGECIQMAQPMTSPRKYLPPRRDELTTAPTRTHVQRKCANTPTNNTQANHSFTDQSLLCLAFNALIQSINQSFNHSFVHSFIQQTSNINA
jgi:hypothetical protein